MFTKREKGNSKVLGLEAASKNNWMAALIYLNRAARQGHVGVDVLDNLGEAAYRTDTPEALGPFQNHYKYPSIASHMARAFLMLGDSQSAYEFLGYAKDSSLKSALLAMLELGVDIKKTAAAFLPVAEKHPDLYYPEFWRALAAVADAVGRVDLTQLSERKSKTYAYKDPNIHFNQALRLLGKGEFRAGWRLYEWRLVPGANQSNRTELGKIPMWEGEKLNGKTLLIYLEQGLGDGIFSLRYVQPLLDEGIKIEIVARPAILPLIHAAYPQIKTHDEDQVAFADYWENLAAPDFWVYGLSIPFRASLWRPINTGRYLIAPPDLVQEIKEKIKLMNPTNLPVYTVNWHGRIETESDRSRAFSVSEFIEVSGINKKPCFIVSLQKEACHDDLEKLNALTIKSGGQFLNAATELSSLAVTAAWIAASNHLLTCDTSVAHLGGSMGHPTTVLVRNKAIWQWLARGEQAVWYDSAQVKPALAPEISWLVKSADKTIDTNVHSKKSNVQKRFRLAGQNTLEQTNKAQWSPVGSIALTAEMKGQLIQQMKTHELKGNKQIANVIEKFLERSNNEHL